ncbi:MULTISPECIES: DUF58 domain-containing protein [unclassified Actinopolyspora]|uniref:DUF58 domain-containing protein n=1 Tax=unclassified Actinopolyspora TaxID=2639451 RepID=UPI0013F61456|nr:MULTISPECIES: DUF58 domain-containing protein [unclassified Actinopolyspora]NHD17135.1 DUF58 domain-containing protein [Actinopolyspora sp. BKK2]NHE76287.1 DUF58 domain-containing protein [Actinopolyspora sp. BKK1]
MRLGTTGLGVLSGLTVRGRCLLAAACAAVVCALVLDERDLLRVAFFAAALPLLTLSISALARTGLRADRELVPRRTAVHTSATVRLRLSSTGRVPPSGLILVDEVPPLLGGTARYGLGGSVGRSGKVVEYTVRPELRGVHQLGPLRCRTRDPFGLSVFEKEIVGSDHLVAVPEVFPLSGLPAAGGGHGGEDSGRMRAGPGSDDGTIREYRHGDDIRRVHWKSTAHRDELMVRVEEGPRHGGVTVLLDHRASAHRGTGANSSLEWAVSAAASICLHLRRRGQRVRLVSTSGRRVAASGSPGSDADEEQDDESVLEALAALQPSARREIPPGGASESDRDLIAVLGRTTPAGAGKLASARSTGSRSAAILLDVDAWAEGSQQHDPASGTAHRLRSAGWTVTTVAGPSSPVALVWESLCEQGTSLDPPRAGP